MLLPEFLAGAWLYLAWQRNKMPGAALGWVMVLAGGLAILLLPSTAGNLMWRPIGLGIPALLIVAGGLTLKSRGRLLRVPGLATLGAASYALYLTHDLALMLVKPLFRPLPEAVALPCVLVVCIAVALLTHHGVELPLTRWLASRPALRRAEMQHGRA